MMYKFTKSLILFGLFLLKTTVFNAQGDITFNFYVDTNCNGSKDATESFISGPADPVLFDLGTGLPSPIFATGNTFVAVPAGNYELQWVNPSNGWVLKTPISGFTSFTHGATNPPPFNAAYYETVTIEGFTWLDANGDGIQSGGETGLDGVNVTLSGTSCGGTVVNSTVTSSGGGIYTFLDVEPSNAAGYNITFSAVAMHQRSAKDLGGNDNLDSDPVVATGIVAGVVVSSGVDINNIDAGYWQFSTISDFVWEDINGNGIQDGGEPGINGVTVNLTGTDGAGNAVSLSDVTAGGGLYDFVNVPPGTNYTVDFILPSANHFFTAQNQGSDATDSDANPANGEVNGVMVISGDIITDIDAGMYIGATIGDFVWEDLNGDGDQDGGEPGFAGVTVSLVGTDGAGMPVVRAPVVTPGSGAYQFINLPPGTYTVTFGPALPANHFFTDPDLAAGNDALDSDADKVTGATPSVTLISDQDITNIDAGVFEAVTIGNLVWEDLNGNGIQDGGEPPLDGVTVSIETSTGGAVTKANGTPAAPVVSGPAGAYVFDVLKPGAYIITFGAFPNYFRTLKDVGADASDSDADIITGKTGIYTLISGDINNTVDGGYFKGCKVGDFTWIDFNGNGLQDGGEAGLGGVNVVLTDGVGGPVTNTLGAAVGPQVSGGAGDYEFADLKPGMYRVTFTAPGGYFPTKLNAAGGAGDAADVANDSDCNQGMANQSHVFTLVSGEEEIDIDAGFYQAVTIGDFVWHDQDADGIQDAGEPGAAGAAIMLMNADGSPLTSVNNTPVATVVTTATGAYQFTNIRPGLYDIMVTPPAMWFLSIPDATADPNDSDFIVASGKLVTPLQVNSGEISNNTDAGIYKNIMLCGTIWGDANDNGLLEGSEGTFPSVTVELMGTAGDGMPISLTTTTNASGTYCFSVKPGDYVVSIPPSMFGAGPLNTLVSCDGQQLADNDVDNDDNGAGEAPATSTTIMVRCGLEPQDMGTTNTTVDFCFKFDCDQPNQYAAPSCDMVVDTFCNLSILNGFCARMPMGPPIGNVPDPLCPGTSTVANNMSWFAFIAGTGNYTITISPFDCVAGTGGQSDVQVGIYQDCSFSNAVFCDGGCNAGPVATTIPSTNLVPGNTYFLFLDGCSGAVCSYEVDVSNFQEYIIPEPTDIICVSDVCTPICPNNLISLQVNSDYEDAILKFTWKVTDPMGNMTTIVTTTNQLQNYLVDKLGLWTFEIISIANKCNSTSIVKSFTVMVRHPDNEDFGEKFVCDNKIMGWPGPNGDAYGNSDPNGDGNVGWQITPYTFEPGVNIANVNSMGCIYTQKVYISPQPINLPFDLVLVLCPEQIPYTISPDFPVVNGPKPETLVTILNGQTNGCDSLVNLTVIVLKASGEIANEGCNNGKTKFRLKNYIIPDWPVTHIIRWRNAAGILVDDGDPDLDMYTIELATPGMYKCEIVMTLNGKTCTTSIPFKLIPSSTLVMPEGVAWPLAFCASTTQTNYSATSTVSNPQWVWTYPAGVTVSGQDTDMLTVNWNGVPGGEICVSIADNCGQSPAYCRTVVINPIPAANFRIDPIICIDSIANVNSTLPFVVGNLPNWNLGGGVIIASPTSNGIDSLDVKWSTPGKKYVTLSVTRNGCTSPIRRDSVEVIARQIAPIVNCTSNATSIEFDWTPISGQTNAVVNVTLGPTGIQNGNTYSITGILPGVTVDIDVVLSSNHPCGDITISGSCITQDCTPEPISMNPIPNICLDANSPIVDLKPFTNTVSTDGTYKFTGTGVTNSIGLFDPKVAGVGTHKIKFDYKNTINCVSPAAFVDIVVNAVPNSTFIGDNIICQDSMATIEYTGNITSGGTFTWDFGPDVITPKNGAGPFTIGWTNPGVKTITLSTSNNGCSSTPSNIKVTVEPRVPPVVLTCPTKGATTLTFDWNDVPNTSGYSLQLNGTNLPNTNVSNLALTGLAVDKDFELIVNANSNNSCPGVSDTLLCTTSSCPPVFIKFSIKDTTICFGTNLPNIDINATVTGGLQSANQTLTWSGGAYIDPVTGIFNPNTAGVGTHPIKISLVDGTCKKDTNMTITIISKPLSTFTGKARICITDAYEVTYTGTPNLPLKWVLPTGVTTNPVTGQPTKFKVTFPKDGVYDLKLLSGNANCVSDTSKLKVTVDPETSGVTVTCQQTTTSITYNWNNILDNCITGYKILINGVDKGTQTSLSYNISNLVIGEKVEIKVVPISPLCTCPPITTTKVCEAKLCPTITSKLSAPNTAFCEGSINAPFQITSTLTGSDGTGVGTWSGTKVSNTGLFNPVNAIPGIYKAYYVFSEQSCDYRDSISITIFDLPKVTAEAVQPDCYLENVGQVTILTSEGTPSYKYTINGATKTLPLGDLTPGNYKVVTLDANNCKDSTSFVIKSADVPKLELTGNTNILSGIETELTATVTGIEATIDSIVWVDTKGFVVCSGNNCTKVKVAPLEDEKYCVTVYYNNGCTVNECIDVIVKKVVIITLPNVFSPLGNNTSFFIANYDAIKIVKSMRVYDRWGNLAYNKENFAAGDPTQGWNGKFNNSTTVVPGVYVYRVEVETIDGRIEQFVGDVTVL